jgi:hypothetical protein
VAEWLDGDGVAAWECVFAVSKGGSFEGAVDPCFEGSGFVPPGPATLLNKKANVTEFALLAKSLANYLHAVED